MKSETRLVVMGIITLSFKPETDGYSLLVSVPAVIDFQD